MNKREYKLHTTKHILNIHKHSNGGWFWDKYTAFPYIGCAWGCEYCYWRDEKYNPHKYSETSELIEYHDPFSELIKVKKDAPELFRKAIKNKPKDLVYLDNYQPVDSQHQYCRALLEICVELNFPVFINEKSPLLLKDIDVIKKLNNASYVNVGWSIISAIDDEKKLAFEPKTPTIKSRFAAMKKLAEEGVLTGTILMPVIPYIFDSEENIRQIIEQTARCGGSYVLEGGLTLWGNCKTHFYKALDKYDSELIPKFEELFASEYKQREHSRKVHNTVVKYCKEYGLTPYIPRHTKCFPKNLQINKEVAAKFFIKARELQLTEGSNYKMWAYLNAARIIDQLETSLDEIYRKEGEVGLKKLKSVGETIAKQIITLLKT